MRSSSSGRRLPVSSSSAVGTRFTCSFRNAFENFFVHTDGTFANSSSLNRLPHIFTSGTSSTFVSFATS